MKIATNTLIVVLVCLLGAAAATGVMAYQYQVMDIAQETREQANLAMRDFGHLQSFFSQWLVTVDLFYTGRQSYLKNGIQRQSGEISELLGSVHQAIEPHIGKSSTFTRISQDLSSVANEVEAVAMQVDGDESTWNDSLSRTDDLTMELITAIDELIADSELLAGRSNATFEAAQRQFNLLFLICAAMYLSIVATTWLWANRKIVQPIVNLTRIAAKEVLDEQDISFDSQHGPIEIRALGERLQEFSMGMHRAHKKAHRSFLDAERDRERINTIMNTAADGIVLVTAENKIESANRAALDLLQLVEDEAVGQPIDRFVAQLNPHRDMCDTPAKKQLHRADLELTRTSDAAVPVDVSVSRMHYGDSENYTIIIRDVTARKANEKRLEELNKQLVSASRLAGIAEVATSILHNAGNVINSVKTSITVIQGSIKQSRLPSLGKGIQLIDAPDKLSALATDPEKASQVGTFLRALNDQLILEQADVASEVNTLDEHVRHIESIIRSQQTNAKHSSVEEELSLSEVFDDSLNMNKIDISNGRIETAREYEEIDSFVGDRHKLALVMVNLIRNATDAILEAKPEQPKLTLSLSQDDRQIYVSVVDNGIGMSLDTLDKLLTHGFTTKTSGHGFGLHSCSLEVKNMGGSLTFSSDGLGQGATFTIILPRASGVLRHANG